ncbi:hypothetical protein QR680_008064 [Steinernema hermaphroditum]|uniref:Uncharacterized protein n=1 Tax=Steinernema hermaphroditum TaxID=289476 RepID=A0AA39M6D5_9BILA|nr:hypothetical protein QR680_008064 [Steinernema hermaphroditum]
MGYGRINKGLSFNKECLGLALKFWPMIAESWPQLLWEDADKRAREVLSKERVGNVYGLSVQIPYRFPVRNGERCRGELTFVRCSRPKKDVFRVKPSIGEMAEILPKGSFEAMAEKLRTQSHWNVALRAAAIGYVLFMSEDVVTDVPKELQEWTDGAVSEDEAHPDFDSLPGTPPPPPSTRKRRRRSLVSAVRDTVGDVIDCVAKGDLTGSDFLVEGPMRKRPKRRVVLEQEKAQAKALGPWSSGRLRIPSRIHQKPTEVFNVAMSEPKMDSFVPKASPAQPTLSINIQAEPQPNAGSVKSQPGYVKPTPQLRDNVVITDADPSETVRSYLKRTQGRIRVAAPIAQLNSDTSPSTSQSPEQASSPPKSPIFLTETETQQDFERLVLQGGGFQEESVEDAEQIMAEEDIDLDAEIDVSIENLFDGVHSPLVSVINQSTIIGGVSDQKLADAAHESTAVTKKESETQTPRPNVRKCIKKIRKSTNNDDGKALVVLAVPEIELMTVMLRFSKQSPPTLADSAVEFFHEDMVRSREAIFACTEEFDTTYREYFRTKPAEQRAEAGKKYRFTYYTNPGANSRRSSRLLW